MGDKSLEDEKEGQQPQQQPRQNEKKTILRILHPNGPHTAPPHTLARSHTRTPLAEHFPLLEGSHEHTSSKLKFSP